MKLRLVLCIISIFSSLAVSGDHTTNSCRDCWLPAADSQTVDQSLGVNVHFNDPPPGEVKMIAEAGFRWIRTDFIWKIIERHPGRYDFAAYDRLMQAIEPFGIRALFILDYGNPLYDNDGPPRSAQARQAFARWAAASAKHFENRGVIWELYNEPNNDQFWPAPSANEYAMLAREVGRVFQSTAPNERLIGPALAKIDLPFLEACFRSGSLESWSAISVHPYRQNAPESTAIEYARLRETITGYQRRGNRAMPIISSEWGYSSAWRGMNEEKQAAMLARQFLTNVANGVPLSIWYDWRDDGADEAQAEYHFGLVRYHNRAQSSAQLDPKPAYFATKTLINQLRGFHFQRRLAIGSDDDYVLVFARGEERRIAAWSTLPAAHLVTIPVSALRFTATSLLGNGKQLTADAGKLTIEISPAPVYLTQD